MARAMPQGRGTHWIIHANKNVFPRWTRTEGGRRIEELPGGVGDVFAEHGVLLEQVAGVAQLRGGPEQRP
jgi:hypothetical protein